MLNVNRTLSSFGISVSTGLALETLVKPTGKRIDDERKIPKYKQTYKELNISLYTLIRNIITSYEFSEQSTIISDRDAVKNITEILLDEMFIISELSLDMNMDINYIGNPHEKWNKVIDEKEAGKAKLTREYTIWRLSRMIVAKLRMKSVYKIKDKPADYTLLLTHLPFECLWKCDVLESHTGVILNRYSLGKMYHSTSRVNFSHLPLTKELLHIIGGKRLVPTRFNRKQNKFLYEKSIELKVNPRSGVTAIVNLVRQDKEIYKLYTDKL